MVREVRQATTGSRLMPWTGEQFSSRHNHGIHGAQAEHAARIANATLRSGVPEGEAIAIGSGWAKRHHRANGGYSPENPQISREDDATILSKGRGQSSQTDINLTPPPPMYSPYGPIKTHPHASWLPGPIPNDDLASQWGHQRQHLDDGGGVGDIQTGIAPSSQTMNPLVQSSIQRYAGLPTEKLAELVARLGPSQQGQLAQKVLQQKRMMPQPMAPQTQQQTAPNSIPGAPNTPAASTPVLPSPQFKRGGAMKRAQGGDMGISPSMAAPWWTRAEARGSDSGFLHGSSPGRADSVLTTAPGGAYVLPSEVLSGLGEGNSLAGARIADAMFSSGPHGIGLPRGGRGMGPPRPPPAFREQASDGGPIKLFKGGAGGAKNGTDVALSHGEFVISPEWCEAFGRGKDKTMAPDVARKRAHRVLDKWVVHWLKEHAKTLVKLAKKGPVKT